MSNSILCLFHAVNFLMSPTNTLLCLTLRIWYVRGVNVPFVSDKAKEYITPLRRQTRFRMPVFVLAFSDSLQAAPLPCTGLLNSCQVYIWSLTIEKKKRKTPHMLFEILSVSLPHSQAHYLTIRLYCLCSNLGWIYSCALKYLVFALFWLNYSEKNIYSDCIYTPTSCYNSCFRNRDAADGQNSLHPQEGTPALNPVWVCLVEKFTFYTSVLKPPL